MQETRFCWQVSNLASISEPVLNDMHRMHTVFRLEEANHESEDSGEEGW
jgi:hypothetical protein